MGRPRGEIFLQAARLAAHAPAGKCSIVGKHMAKACRLGQVGLCAAQDLSLVYHHVLNAQQRHASFQFSPLCLLDADGGTARDGRLGSCSGSIPATVL
jgi:hypothetical protein